jgi:hypothetical protein
VISRAGNRIKQRAPAQGGDQEAFWGDYFNGSKDENPWVAHAPPERLPKERRPIEIFGLRIAERERPVDLGRLFMSRFGDIARVEAQGRDVRVTLKSGTVFDLDRFEASDFDDGVRVWDGRRGVVDLDSLQIRTIELLPTPSLHAVPYRLHGTVRTRQGDSPASSSGTGRRASAPTSSMATLRRGCSACVSTRSAPSRAARATAPW